MADIKKGLGPDHVVKDIDMSGYATSSHGSHVPTGGTTGKYLRGDNTWQNKDWINTSSTAQTKSGNLQANQVSAAWKLRGGDGNGFIGRHGVSTAVPYNLGHSPSTHKYWIFWNPSYATSTRVYWNSAVGRSVDDPDAQAMIANPLIVTREAPAGGFGEPEKQRNVEDVVGFDLEPTLLKMAAVIHAQGEAIKALVNGDDPAETMQRMTLALQEPHHSKCSEEEKQAFIQEYQSSFDELEGDAP